MRRRSWSTVWRRRTSVRMFAFEGDVAGSIVNSAMTTSQSRNWMPWRSMQDNGLAGMRTSAWTQRVTGVTCARGAQSVTGLVANLIRMWLTFRFITTYIRKPIKMKRKTKEHWVGDDRGEDSYVSFPLLRLPLHFNELCWRTFLSLPAKVR